jgi:hypothetical protein
MILRRFCAVGKLYVPVMVRITEDGEITPLRIKLQTEADSLADWVKISRAVNLGRKASKKAGGVGIMYNCIINYEELKRNMDLYNEEGKWFIETND